MQRIGKNKRKKVYRLLERIGFVKFDKLYKGYIIVSNGQYCDIDLAFKVYDSYTKNVSSPKRHKSHMTVKKRFKRKPSYSAKRKEEHNFSKWNRIELTSRNTTIVFK